MEIDKKVYIHFPNFQKRCGTQLKPFYDYKGNIISRIIYKFRVLFCEYHKQMWNSRKLAETTMNETIWC